MRDVDRCAPAAWERAGSDRWLSRRGTAQTRFFARLEGIERSKPPRELLRRIGNACRDAHRNPRIAIRGQKIPAASQKKVDANHPDQNNPAPSRRQRGRHVW